MNHKQKEIDFNLELITVAKRWIEYSKKMIESERIKLNTFQQYISYKISSNKALRKHEMYNDGFRTYCLECGEVEMKNLKV